MEHFISHEVRDAQIERLVSDSNDQVHLHLDNGLILAFVAHMVDGMARLTLHIVEPGEQTERAVH
jgi:hypothetical protein